MNNKKFVVPITGIFSTPSKRNKEKQKIKSDHQKQKKKMTLKIEIICLMSQMIFFLV